jgi:hypothetical protein
MKQNKKPTYKELEEYKFSIKILLVYLIAVSVLFFIFFCLTIHYQEENQQLKSQLNLTENEIQEFPVVDYHSSGELFCEHYNGEYYPMGFTYNAKCGFIISEVMYFCKIGDSNPDTLDEYFIFVEPCEVIE